MKHMYYNISPYQSAHYMFQVPEFHGIFLPAGEAKPHAFRPNIDVAISTAKRSWLQKDARKSSCIAKRGTVLLILARLIWSSFLCTKPQPNVSIAHFHPPKHAICARISCDVLIYRTGLLGMLKWIALLTCGKQTPAPAPTPTPPAPPWLVSAHFSLSSRRATSAHRLKS